MIQKTIITPKMAMDNPTQRPKNLNGYFSRKYPRRKEKPRILTMITPPQIVMEIMMELITQNQQAQQMTQKVIWGDITRKLWETNVPPNLQNKFEKLNV